jgi:hypothetical protein
MARRQILYCESKFNFLAGTAFLFRANHETTCVRCIRAHQVALKHFLTTCFSNDLRQTDFVKAYLTRVAISFDVIDLEAHLQFLTKVKHNVEILLPSWVQAVHDNLSPVDFTPLGLVGKPLHFQHDLDVGLVAALIQISEVFRLHENGNDSEVGDFVLDHSAFTE